MKRFMLFLTCLLMMVGSVMAQSQRVTGTVTDAADGKPIQGARVFVNGTSIGTVTDARGMFQLNVPQQHKELTVTFIGMKTQKVPVASTVNVKLSPNEQMLDEAIVTAYGTVKKSAFTGSAAEVKSEDITNHVAASAMSSVSGKVAGVQTTSTGGPGSAPTIRIRGFGSMSASNEPLYVIDGVPTSMSITNLNPQDIASISIQKDAASNALYGARAANGVVIVTTKKAKQGAPAKINFDARWGSNSRLIPQYDVITDPAEYYETHYKALYNSKYYHGSTAAEAYAYADKYLLDQTNGGLGYLVYTVPEGERLIGTNFKLNPHAKLGYSDGTYYYKPDDWYDETFHNSFRQEYNASVSGSNDRMNYYASVGYLRDGGAVANSRYERYTALTNIDYQAKKWLKLNTNMGFTQNISQTPSYSDTYGSSGNVFYVTNNMGPIYPLYVRDAQGNIMRENGRIIYDANQTNFTRPNIVGNAVRDNAYDSDHFTSDLFRGLWGAVITPIEGLSLTANLSAEIYNGRSTSLAARYGGGSGSDGVAAVGHERLQNITQQYLAQYTRTFAEKHNGTVLVGYEQANITENALSGKNDHLFDPYIGELNNAKGTKNKSVSSNSDELTREGFFGRLMYDYDSKYFASVGIRRDASSKFAPGHRWGTFGYLSAAWMITKEDFMKPYKWLNELKLKASWGCQGNDLGIGYHAYSDYYTTSYNEETGQYSVAMSAKGNDELTWEKNKEWNFGVEFAMFDSRLSGIIEFYTRNTSDLLYNRTLPLSSGYNVSDYPVNVGAMRNTGIEVSLEGVPVRTTNFEWDVNLNFTHNYNKITKLDPTVPKEGLKSSNRIIKEGKSLYEMYMVKYAGVDKSTGEALYYKDTKDNDGNTVTTTTNDLTKADKYDLGTSLPDLIGGFGTGVKFYGFDLSAQFAFSLGGKMYDGSYQALMHNGQSPGSALHKDILKAWSPENPNSNIPRLSVAAADDPGSGSQTPIDRFVTSTNYLSLNNLTLGYTLPKTLVEKASLSNVRVYVSGENLFVTSKRKGMDPRYSISGIGSMTSGSGLNTGGYATMRSLVFGISLTF